MRPVDYLKYAESLDRASLSMLCNMVHEGVAEDVTEEFVHNRSVARETIERLVRATLTVAQHT